MANPMTSTDSTSLRDQCAALLEQMSQRNIRQLAECCVDHLDDVGEWKSLADYLRLHIVLNAAKTRPEGHNR